MPIVANVTRVLATTTLALTMVTCDQNDYDLAQYNQFLGQEKAQALDEGVAVFDQFVKDNFAHLPSQGLRIEAFLEQLAASPHYDPDANWLFDNDPDWVFDSPTIATAFQNLETTGMRQEIRHFGYELKDTNATTLEAEAAALTALADSATLDSAQMSMQARRERAERITHAWFIRGTHANTQGKYLQGLHLIEHRDIRIERYIDAVEENNGTALGIAVEGALRGYDPKDYEDPFIKRILFAEIFWHVMKWDVERRR